MKVYALLVFLGLAIEVVQAQSIVDTSYTIRSTYQKDLRKFPFISIALPKTYNDVRTDKDLVYGNNAPRPLHFDAFYSKKHDKNPGVILLHGGGWKSGNKSQMDAIAAELAFNGYACFNIEYQLSPEAMYPQGILDVKNAIAYIRKHAKKFNLDSSKIAVLGCSSGGQMATLIGTTNDNRNFQDSSIKDLKLTRVQAIVNLDGIVAFHHPESQEGLVAAKWLGGTYDEIPAVWEQASALTHVDGKTPPVLFINSDMDRFHAGRSDFISKLKPFKTYSEVHTFEGSPHSFWFFNPWFDNTVAWTVMFLDKIFKS